MFLLPHASENEGPRLFLPIPEVYPNSNIYVLDNHLELLALNIPCKDGSDHTSIFTCHSRRLEKQAESRCISCEPLRKVRVVQRVRLSLLPINRDL